MPINPSNLVPQPGETEFAFLSRIVTEAENFGATAGDALIVGVLFLLIERLGLFTNRPFT